jgi:transcription initiation factor TFIID subunit 4
VRTEMGQLVMVPQQALAQAQAQAQTQAQNNISPRTATTTAGATFRATTLQVRVNTPLSLPQCNMPLVVQ